MKPKNKYAHRSKISEAKFREMLRLFALDIEANKIAELTGLSRDTVNRYVMAIRERIAAECERAATLSGDIEVDESYFGPKRVKGKWGRGAGGKTVVFGIFKRNGKVYTEIVPDAKKDTLQAVIRGKVDLESVIHSDGWRAYDGLVDLGYKQHVRIKHSSDEFSGGNGRHINGIEAFWGSVKTRLHKRRGIRKEYLYLHLKECELRFNHRDDDLYQLLLDIIRENPLFSS